MTESRVARILLLARRAPRDVTPRSISEEWSGRALSRESHERARHPAANAFRKSGLFLTRRPLLLVVGARCILPSPLPPSSPPPPPLSRHRAVEPLSSPRVLHSRGRRFPARRPRPRYAIGSRSFVARYAVRRRRGRQEDDRTATAATTSTTTTTTTPMLVIHNDREEVDIAKRSIDFSWSERKPSGSLGLSALRSFLFPSSADEDGCSSVVGRNAAITHRAERGYRRRRRRRGERCQQRPDRCEWHVVAAATAAGTGADVDADAGRRYNRHRQRRGIAFATQQRVDTATAEEKVDTALSARWDHPFCFVSEDARCSASREINQRWITRKAGEIANENDNINDICSWR